MADREILEMAAKAAGINIVGIGEDGEAEREDGGWWNPLEDDGDALRLAVALNRTDIGSLIMNHTTGAEYRKDKYAATRRAITRAAAEIGSAMP